MKGISPNNSVTNESQMPLATTRSNKPFGGERQDALPAALVAAHLIMTVDGGAFLSMTDPPEWANREDDDVYAD